MTSPPTARLVVLLLACAGMVLASGCGRDQTNPPSQADAPTMPASAAPTTPSTTAPKELAISAEEFTKDCLKDQNAADKKYGGKVLLVEGVIFKSRMLPPGDSWSILLFGFKEASTGAERSTTCEFEQKSPSFSKLGKLVTGQKVKIKGGYDLTVAWGPRISKCALVEAGPDPAIHVMATQLTKEYAADENTADAKYNRKQLVVEGVVAVQPPQENANTIYLEGFNPDAEKPWRVSVFASSLEKEFRVLKKGQKVRVRGEGHGTTGPAVDLWAETVEVVP